MPDFWEKDLKRQGTPLKERQLQAGIGQSQASAANLGASAAETAAGLPFVAPLKAADVRKTEADAALAAQRAKDAKAAQAKAQKASKNAAFTLRESTDEMLGNIRNARRQVTPWATGWGALLKNVPDTEALGLQEALRPISANTMLGKMKELKEASPTGATGFGNQTEREGKALIDSISSLEQKQSQEQLNRSLAAIEKHYRRYYAYTRGENPDEPKVAARYGIILPSSKPPRSGPPPGGKLTGEVEEVAPAELRGVNDTVANMLRAGVTSDEVRGYLNEIQPGLGDKAQNIEWYEDYYRQNPKGKVEPQIDLERFFRPKEGAARAVGEIAQSPAGAAVIGSTDVLTGGMLDEMTSNPELTRSVMSSVQEENPGSYLTGQILGGTLGSAGLAGGAGRLGLKLAPGTMAALEGGTYGFGSADSDSALDRLGGAGIGAATGVVGQKVLGSVAKGAGALVGGARNKAAELLDKYGVPLTLGEIAGGKLAALEQKVGQLPIVGDLIHARQGDSIEGFNRAAFDKSLETIGGSTQGKIGEQGINSAKKQIGDFYDNLLRGQQFTPDTQFLSRTQAIRDAIHNDIPNEGAKAARDVTEAVGDFFDPSKVMSGEEWQQGLRALKKVSKDYQKTPYGNFVQKGVNDLLGEFNDLAARQSPDIVPGLEAANTAWRRYSILKDAVRDMSHANVGRGVFVPETLFQKSALNAERFGGRGASAEGSHPFYELADAGIDTMTPVRQRSLTVPYLLPASAAGLAGYTAHQMQGTKGKDGEIEGRDPVLSAILGGTAGLALATPYSKVAQKYLQKALTGPRSAGAKAAGDFLREKVAPIAGAPFIAPLVGAYQGNLPNTDYLPSVEEYTELPGLPDAGPAASAVPAEPMAIDVDEEGYATLPDGTRVLVRQP